MKIIYSVLQKIHESFFTLRSPCLTLGTAAHLLALTFGTNRGAIWWICMELIQAYCTVEPRYNEVLGTMKITLLYQVSHYIRVKKQRNIMSWDQQTYLVIKVFFNIWPLYNEVPLYCTHSHNSQHGRIMTTQVLMSFHSLWIFKQRVIQIIYQPQDSVSKELKGNSTPKQLQNIQK